MDLFKYTASVKEIEMCNTVSGIEKLIRNYNGSISIQPYEIKPVDVLYYKLYTLALNKFENLSKRILPEFLYENRLRVQTFLLSSIFEYEEKRSLTMQILRYLTKHKLMKILWIYLSLINY